MNLGFYIELERAEAVERAMPRHRAPQPRERRRTVPGRVTGKLSRQEALNRIARTHPRAALKILNAYGIGGRRPIPEVRGGQ
jgi:hypothetical protein